MNVNTTKNKWCEYKWLQQTIQSRANPSSSSNLRPSRGRNLGITTQDHHHGFFVVLDCQVQAQEITREVILCKYSRQSKTELHDATAQKKVNQIVSFLWLSCWIAATLQLPEIVSQAAASQFHPQCHSNICHCCSLRWIQRQRTIRHPVEHKTWWNNCWWEKLFTAIPFLVLGAGW